MHCSFIPAYLLQRLIAVSDDEHVCHCGRATLHLDARLRHERETTHDLLAPAAPDLAAKRVVHTARHTEQLPGKVARIDDQGPTGDLAVDEAFDSSKIIWDLFAQQFGRLSIDGQGSPLSITVHFSTNYDNAFWDGHQLVFGDGDGKIFARFTKPMDVMAHEFTHGVTQFTAALHYEGQSGALNESVSDVFAAMAKQRMLNQTADQADWLIGEGLFLPGVEARGLRSMSEPGTAYDDPQLGSDPQVGSMQDYVETTDDNGGVHLNSGIPNRAFSLACLRIGGYSWEKAGQIWYRALTGGEVHPDCSFAEFAKVTVDCAHSLFPSDSSIAEQVTEAWSEVGVLGQESIPMPMVQDQMPATDQVVVRRSGGFAGTIRTGRIDLASDPIGPRVLELLNAANFAALSSSTPAPDRFVYTVEYGSQSVSVSELDLSPELHQIVQLVLGDPMR